MMRMLMKRDRGMIIPTMMTIWMYLRLYEVESG